MLSRMLQNGEGCDQNNELAEQWRLKAAEQRHPTAIMDMARNVATLIESAMWFEIAQITSTAVAFTQIQQAQLEQVHSQMSSDEIAEAKARAARWSEKHKGNVADEPTS